MNPTHPADHDAPDGERSAPSGVTGDGTIGIVADRGLGPLAAAWILSAVTGTELLASDSSARQESRIVAASTAVSATGPNAGKSRTVATAASRIVR